MPVPPNAVTVSAVSTETKFSFPLEITKRDDDRRVVFGFAKFSEDPENRGFMYIDKQGDVITPADLEDSAYEYVLTSRDAGEMHISKGAATLVESVVITPEKLEAWGLAKDAMPVAWWTGYKVAEVAKGQEDPWDKIKKGEYTGFSVEGTAYRDPLAPPQVKKKVYASEDLVLSADELEGISKLHDFAGARDHIKHLLRSGQISPPEADQMLRNLVEEDDFLIDEFLEEEEIEEPEDLMHPTVLRFLRDLLGIAKGQPTSSQVHVDKPLTEREEEEEEEEEEVAA